MQGTYNTPKPKFMITKKGVAISIFKQKILVFIYGRYCDKDRAAKVL